jgi:PAS domain S-box-containing protein
VQALLGTFIDITERKRAEETLRTREQHLSRVYDAVDDVVFLLSVDAGEQYRFVSINAAFARVTGFTAESVLGQAVSSVVPAAALPQLLEKCREAIEHRRLVRWEEIVDYPAGRLFGEIAVAPVFDRAGRCIQLVGSIHDVTERNRAWDEINSLNAHLQRHAEELEQRVSERTSELARAKERAESADRLKSAFLATMSHELRTPLNSIIGFTGIVMQEMAGPLNEEQKKQLGMVYGSAQHLLALINDVLDISKIEAGELVVSAAPFDLRASIGKVTGLIQPLADNKGLELGVHIAEGIGDMVGDARRVEQILLNLLSNAVKFTERGAVSLTAELVRDHGAPDASSDPAVQLRVKDTGIGIQPENMVLLFAPFRQIDSTLTRAYEGTGLGLAISQRLAALMGGRIQATSRWQHGSEFIVTLPLREPQQGRA